MELTLTNLSDDNAESFKEQDQATGPDRQRAYNLMPIFCRLAPSELMSRVRAFNHYHKCTFALLFHRHFLLCCQMDNTSRYRMCADLIKALRDMVATELQQTRLIERHSYEYYTRYLCLQQDFLRVTVQC